MWGLLISKRMTTPITRQLCHPAIHQRRDVAFVFGWNIGLRTLRRLESAPRCTGHDGLYGRDGRRPRACQSFNSSTHASCDAAAASLRTADGTRLTTGTERTISTLRPTNISESGDSDKDGDDYGDDDDNDSDEETGYTLRETDLEEQFVRGSGPGGQKINKSSVCVVSLKSPQLLYNCFSLVTIYFSVLLSFSPVLISALFQRQKKNICKEKDLYLIKSTDIFFASLY